MAEHSKMQDSKVHQNIRELLNVFHSNEIKYCHFKSNEHVFAGMCGDTDLDILVDRSDYVKCVEFLAASGFKRFTTQHMASYPGVDDWIGFEPGTGELSHLHLHWQLVTGKPHLKEYRLPWEQEVLHRRLWDKENEIFISSPEVELVLLLVRASLKYRFRDAIRLLLGKPYPSVGGDIRREFDWLIPKIDFNETKNAAAQLVSPEVVTSLDSLLQNGFDDKAYFYTFRDQVVKSLRQNRTYGGISSITYRWYREFYSRSTAYMIRTGRPVLRRRSPATSGAIIAFLGADGSGKSTQATEVVKWLGWKADTTFVYLGSGDGEVSLVRKLIVSVKKSLTRYRTKEQSSVGQGEQKRGAPTQKGLKRLYYAFWALSLAREKYVRLERAARARNKGMIIVCDRYPQNQIEGFNDGPLLTEWQNDSWLWKNFSRLEAKAYALAESLPPDIVVKLNVTEAIAAERKADTPAEMIVKKIEAVKQLKFDSRCRIIEVNADQELGEVTRVIRNEIWNIL